MSRDAILVQATTEGIAVFTNINTTIASTIDARGTTTSYDSASCCTHCYF